MKNFLQLIGVIFLLILVLPILPLLQTKSVLQDKKADYAKTSSVASSSTSQSDKTPASPTKEEENSSAETSSVTEGDSITVFRNDSSEQQTIPMRDYLIGVVLCEMPASFEDDAIKAQVVVANTYASYQMTRASTLTDSPSTHQAYEDLEQLKKRFGKNFDSYYQKVAACVDAVYPQILTYKKEPILAAFHAISSGRTETAASVWGSDYPYLTAVDSEGDSLCTEYNATKSVTEQEVQTILKDSLQGVKLPKDPSQWMIAQKNTPSGYVDLVKVGDQSLSGQQVRRLFSLRSASFNIQHTEGNFTFTTRGYGHGVGMSQYGANYYAKQGQTYKEILAHYYPKTVLEKEG